MSETEEKLTLRARLYKEIDPSARNIEGLSAFNKFVIFTVLLASFVAIMQTEPSVAAQYERDFFLIEICAGALFIVEYLMRFWTAPENPEAKSAWGARMRFIVSPMAILDLVIIASIFLPLILENSAFFRMLRVLRILALARLTRFSRALQHLVGAIAERRYDLAITLGMAGFLLLFGSSALYWLEGDAQPEAFGSIPRALWWAVITLTTVGYGDVSPITVEGKIIASFVALAGVALVALPTGILAAAFSDAMQRQREILAQLAAEEAGEDDVSK